MNDIMSCYLHGSYEGYFNVRLEYTILDMDQRARALFLNGYQFGKNIKNENHKFSNDSYLENRNTFITIMGYRAATEGLTLSSQLLKGKDKEAFETGYKVGLQVKDGKTEQLDGNDLCIYASVMGYEINDESYNLCVDIFRDEIRSSFRKGHNIGRICQKIQDTVVEEINNQKYKRFGAR